MENKKEIVILSGGGHKGIVKLQGDLTGNGKVKGSCNLDFRPTNAWLYLVGDNVTKTALNDINTTFEVPFCAKDKFGCAVRSSSVTMFGGSISNTAILTKIDEYNKKSSPQSCKKSAPLNTVVSSTNTPPKQSAPLTLHDVTELDECVKYDGNNFYYAVKPQLDELFVCYPEEPILTNAVASSKWVRVDADDDCYVVGLLFKGDEPEYLCYGVPSSSITSPPQELDGACSWLSISEDEGYWIIYQSAHTGEIIKNHII